MEKSDMKNDDKAMEEGKEESGKCDKSPSGEVPCENLSQSHGENSLTVEGQSSSGQTQEDKLSESFIEDEAGETFSGIEGMGMLKEGERIDTSEDIGERDGSGTSNEFRERAETSEEIGEGAETSEEIGERAETSEELGERAETSEEIGERAETLEELEERAETSTEIDERCGTLNENEERDETSTEIGEASETSEEIGERCETSTETGGRDETFYKTNRNEQLDESDQRNETFNEDRTGETSSTRMEIDETFNNQETNKTDETSREKYYMETLKERNDSSKTFKEIIEAIRMPKETVHSGGTFKEKRQKRTRNNEIRNDSRNKGEIEDSKGGRGISRNKQNEKGSNRKGEEREVDSESDNTPNVSKEMDESGKEEGELEEGELEDEEGEETSEREQNKENRNTSKEKEEEKKEETIIEKNELPEKDNKGAKEDRKRKHNKEFDEERKKKKKRKHQYGSEEEEIQNKFGPEREKSYADFDTLLQQMYIVGSGGHVEGSASPEEEHYNRPQMYQGLPQFKGPNDVESYESGSDEDWEEKPRRRLKRKRRGSRSPSRKGEAICMFYLHGSCKRGADCPYSHEMAPARKMELCKFYMMDCCAKKGKCLYMHKDFPCKYFHFGMKCKAGDSCKFSHDPLDDVTRNILLKHIELAPKDILGDFPRVSKFHGQSILSVTEAKRKGEEPSDVDLESLIDFERKGFKYLDRALKNVRKKRNTEKKSKEKEREKEDKERSPKKQKSRDDYRDPDSKDRDRENKEPGFPPGRDRERHRERDKERDRNRERRHRPKGGEYSPHKMREYPHRPDIGQHLEESRGRDSRGRAASFDNRMGPFGGAQPPGESATKWYSSDEEGEGNHGFSRGQNYSPSPEQRHPRSGDGFSQTSGFQSQGGMQGHSQGFPQNSFSMQSSLPDIDVSYLKNVLSAVQSQSSQKNSAVPSTHGNKYGSQDIRDGFPPNSWDSKAPNNKCSPPRGNRPMSSSYLDMANDIKEVFYDAPSTQDDIARSVDTLLQNLKGRSSCTSEQDSKDGRPSRISRDFHEGPSDSSWNLGSSSRRDSGRDFASPPSGYRDNNDERGFGRDPRYPRENINQWNDQRSWDQRNPRDDSSEYSSREKFLYMDEERKLAKEDIDLRVLPSAGQRLNESAEAGKPKEVRSPVSASEAEHVSPSIYDFDLRQVESLKKAQDSALEELGALPFKVPTHSAKEIDASINTHTPIYYQLILVDIPKPDFSKLKVNLDDPKTCDDPRLRKMVRRSSTEESKSSPKSAKLETEVSFGSPPTFDKGKGLPEIDSNRDPRRPTSRDPRTDAKGLLGRQDSRPDPRVDPRVAIRADPRTDPRADPRAVMGGRLDPRMDSRDPRLDVRDSVMDSEMRESDIRGPAPFFPNGMMEGPNFSQFNPLGNLSVDPRGRPGLLGPAPGPGPNKNMALGLAGQIPQNPFILQQGLGVPYLSGDRGDLIGVPGPSFHQGQWSGGRSNVNDPRLNRDVEVSSFSPGS